MVEIITRLWDTNSFVERIHEVKRFLFIFILSSVACVGVVSHLEILYAQTFPQIVHAEVDVPTDITISSYKITWDAAAPVTYNNITTPICTNGGPCVKSPTISINDSNVHTVSIVAHSPLGGDSLPLVATFQIKTPLKPTSTGSVIQPGT